MRLYSEPSIFKQQKPAVGIGNLRVADDNLELPKPKEKTFFDSLYDSMDEKVGGDGLFSGATKGDMMAATGIVGELGRFQDQMNNAQDLQRRAQLAPTEALLGNKISLPKKQNGIRALASDFMGMNDQFQNIADAKAAKENSKKLSDFFDRSLRSLDAAKDPSKKQIV
jgi:hypothetical protein